MTKTLVTSDVGRNDNNFYVQPTEPYFWTYPTVSSATIIIEDKTKKAIEIIQLLRKNKKIKVESIDNFIELVKEISELI